MPTAADLTRMRATLQAKVLPDSCTISRKTDVKDGAGGETVAWTTVASSVPCRLDPGTYAPDERELAAKLVGITAKLVELPTDQDAIAADRITINGQVFEVQGIEQRGEWELSRRAVCIEVR